MTKPVTECMVALSRFSNTLEINALAFHFVADAWDLHKYLPILNKMEGMTCSQDNMPYSHESFCRIRNSCLQLLADTLNILFET